MERSGDMACEYCFGNLYIWAPVYENTICEYDGMFLARDGVGDPMYLYPCGDGDKKAAVNELIRYAEITTARVLPCTASLRQMSVSLKI